MYITHVSTDINECTIGMDDCHYLNADCVNIPGSYLCICKDGYVERGIACAGIIM